MLTVRLIFSEHKYMRFADVKVGDVVFVPHESGLNHGWGKTAYREVFWVAATVDKVTNTQFTAGGLRFKKSGAGVGHSAYAYKSGEQYSGGVTVPSQCQSEDKKRHQRSLRLLAEVRGIQLDIHAAPSLEVALRAAVLIREAHTLLPDAGDDV
jgi:hypothetical protein